MINTRKEKRESIENNKLYYNVIISTTPLINYIVINLPNSPLIFYQFPFRYS